MLAASEGDTGSAWVTALLAIAPAFAGVLAYTVLRRPPPPPPRPLSVLAELGSPTPAKPTPPPLPAIAFPLHVRLAIPPSADCRTTSASLEIDEVSSAWGPSRDPDASRGVHGVRATFRNPSKVSCCPPVITLATPEGTAHESIGRSSYDLGPSVLCEPGAVARAHVGLTSPAGTRRLDASVAFDTGAITRVAIDLESGDARVLREGGAR